MPHYICYHSCWGTTGYPWGSSSWRGPYLRPSQWALQVGNQHSAACSGYDPGYIQVCCSHHWSEFVCTRRTACQWIIIYIKLTKSIIKLTFYAFEYKHMICGKQFSFIRWCDIMAYDIGLSYGCILTFRKKILRPSSGQRGSSQSLVFADSTTRCHKAVNPNLIIQSFVTTQLWVYLHRCHWPIRKITNSDSKLSDLNNGIVYLSSLFVKAD